ncbi:MAG: pantoate--beta-alanine ligase [Proteobacteria bacterium]|nr:MAG: pantoate--beta-alanine ligase [Pseudomonadota bacterium]
MIVLESPAEASRWCEDQRRRGRSIGMVPTMGALHDGHLELVARCARENEVCVVSIFVNPLQFNERSDFDAYPRDIQADAALLERHGCDMAFTGSLMDFFPEANGEQDIKLLDPGPFADGLEGEHRPGHFAGVRTIVERLFLTVRPERAYFGEKDFQQTLVVKDLAAVLGFPKIVVCETMREPSGLAMSSRNRRLSATQRADAAIIFRALNAARDAWRDGERRRGALSNAMRNVLRKGAVEVEYAEVRDPGEWANDDPETRLMRAHALVAARCGGVRLIDNLALD